jgi:hypothetical protein
MDDRRLEDGSPAKAKIRRSGAWFTTAAPRSGASPNNSATTTGGDEALVSTGRPLCA